MTPNLRTFAIPLRTIDPTDTDFADLAPFRSLVGDARVVSIGESAHLIHEFWQLRDRLLRYLVAELGFTAFVLEAGFVEGLSVNEWVLGRSNTDLEHLTRTKLQYRFGLCPEVRTLLQWMRDWNATHERKVHFYGMDTSGWSTNPLSAIDACLARIDAQPGDAEFLELAALSSSCMEAFHQQAEAVNRYNAMNPEERERLSQGIVGLIQRAKASGDPIAYRCALSAQSIEENLARRLSSQTQEKSENIRDLFMADTVGWILEREARIVIGGHNIHLYRGTLDDLPMLGSLLSPALGKDMVVIGTTYASGQTIRLYPAKSFSERTISLDELHPPEQSLDALMDSAGLPLHVVDLRRLPAEEFRHVTAMLRSHDLTPVSPQHDFDALVHFRHVTLSENAFAGLVEDHRLAIREAVGQ